MRRLKAGHSAANRETHPKVAPFPLLCTLIFAGEHSVGLGLRVDARLGVNADAADHSDELL